MSDKARSLDVWLVEADKVYREVPFTVVADWAQQGRLVEDDKVRVAGRADWRRIGDTPAFAAYLPRAEPFHADDQAEALAAVEGEFTWRPRADDDDGDVDMIPLIDISLVLLIFFIMTTTVAVASFTADLPSASYAGELTGSSNLMVGIQRRPDGSASYAIGIGANAPTASDQGLTEDQAVERVKALAGTGPTEVRIAADRGLKTAVVVGLTGRLQALKPAVTLVRAEVHEKKP